MSRKKRGGKPADSTGAILFLCPYLLLFGMFILLPIVLAIALSFTYFDGVQTPTFAGLSNYITILTQDRVLMEHVLPNTIWIALICGPVSLALQFLLAWMLAHIPPRSRTVLALIFYSPSMTGGVTMAVIWKVLFSGDRLGYINGLLLNWGIIDAPIQFLQNTQYILPLVVIVTLWSSMGVGFLSILAGLLNVDESLYEAAAIDGVKNRFQEMIYVTIPSMKPQMLFAAVMQIVGAFQNGTISAQLAGNPTPGYAAQLIVNHIEDYGFIRYEMGYAAAVSVVLLLIVQIFSVISNRLFGEND